MPIAVGVVGSGLGFSTIIGPLLGGALIDHYGYRGVFWFCFSYACVFGLLLRFCTPESGVHANQRPDFVGAVLLTAGLAALLVAITKGSDWGWGTGRTIGYFVAAAVLLAVFLVAETRVSEPLIDLRLLASPALPMVMLAGFLANVTIPGYALVIPQMLETPAQSGIDYGFGLSAQSVAYHTITQGLVAVVIGPIAGHFTKRYSPRNVMIGCFASFGLSMVLLGYFHAHTWQILLIVAVEGLGFACYYAAAPNLVIEAVPATHTGVSAGMLGTAQSVGGAVTTVLIGVILEHNVLRTDTATNLPLYSVGGYRTVFWLMAAASIAGLLATLAMRHGRRPATGGQAATPIEQVPEAPTPA